MGGRAGRRGGAASGRRRRLARRSHPCRHLEAPVAPARRKHPDLHRPAAGRQQEPVVLGQTRPRRSHRQTQEHTAPPRLLSRPAGGPVCLQVAGHGGRVVRAGCCRPHAGAASRTPHPGRAGCGHHHQAVLSPLPGAARPVAGPDRGHCRRPRPALVCLGRSQPPDVRLVPAKEILFGRRQYRLPAEQTCRITAARAGPVLRRISQRAVL